MQQLHVMSGSQLQVIVEMAMRNNDRGQGSVHHHSRSLVAHAAGLGGCPEHSGGPAQMEMRYKEVDRARNIFERYVRCIPTVKSYVRYAKFEMRNGDVARSRRSYERAVEELGEDAQTVRPSPALHCLTGSNTPASSASCLFGCSIAT